MAYGCHEERYPLPIAAVDTHRPNPKKHAASSSVSGDVTAPEQLEKKTEQVARDYFGTATGGVGVRAEQVTKALEKGMEQGGMTPKAAATQV